MSRERQRDAETDRLLRAMLQLGVHHEACPDADTLAAYAEGVGAPTERGSLEAHFAECHRCQQALAFIARAWPLPEDEAQAHARARWWSLPMRWLVPIAATAVVVMYFAVRPVIAPYFPATAPASNVAQAPAPEHVVANAQLERREPSAVAPTGATGTDQAAKSAEPKGLGGGFAAQETAPQSKAGGGQRALPPGTRDNQGTNLMAQAGTAAPGVGTREKGRDAVPAAPNAKPSAVSDIAVSVTADVSKPISTQAASVGRVDPPPPESRLRAVGESVAAVAGTQAKAAPAPTPAMAPAVAPGIAGAPATDAQRYQRALRAEEAVALPDVASPDGESVWVFASGGRLWRSTDRRATWQPQTSGVTADLLAGSAPSATVCWLVGRDATVLVTTDRTRWSRVVFPEHVDLVTVTATDARSATVTTRDGRRFVTGDAGATWTLR